MPAPLAMIAVFFFSRSGFVVTPLAEALRFEAIVRILSDRCSVVERRRMRVSL